MNYKQLVKETEHVEALLKANQSARGRHWIAGQPGTPGSLLINVHLHTDFDGGLQVNLNPSRWMVDPGARCSLPDGRVFTGGFYNHDYHGAHNLTALQFRWMAEARETIDRWIKGELESLPDQPDFSRA